MLLNPIFGSVCFNLLIINYRLENQNNLKKGVCKLGAKLSQSLSEAGVTAYQDDVDPSVFHYYPMAAECKLGETLTEFKVTYWGIGSPYIARIENDYYDAVGAILAGRATVDITEVQRNKITEAIRSKYNLEPKLSPLC